MRLVGVFDISQVDFSFFRPTLLLSDVPGSVRIVLNGQCILLTGKVLSVLGSIIDLVVNISKI